MRANASKRRQTRTNASKRRGGRTQANASKREQTWTNANKRLHPPFFAGFYTPPLCNPLNLFLSDYKSENKSLNFACFEIVDLSEGFCSNPRGAFPKKRFRLNLRGIFRWIFGAFSLETREKSSAKNPQQNSNLFFAGVGGGGPTKHL